MKKNGFTLVELLTVITILGVVVVFLIGANLGILGGARDKIDDLALKQFYDGGKLFLADIDNGLYGYTFAIDERIGTFNYIGNKFRVMLDYAEDEDSSKIKTVSFTKMSDAVSYFANENNTASQYYTKAQLEVDTFAGIKATTCDSFSVIVEKKTGDKIDDIYIWCKYHPIDDTLTTDVDESTIMSNVKIIKLSNCIKKVNGGSGAIIGGQTESSYCTKFSDSYFTEATVQYLQGNMIYGYEARLYMTGTHLNNEGTQTPNFFTITAWDLSRLGYYNDGKCDYNLASDERKCRVKKEEKLEARIKTIYSDNKATVLSDGYEVKRVDANGNKISE